MKHCKQQASHLQLLREVTSFFYCAPAIHRLKKDNYCWTVIVCQSYLVSYLYRVKSGSTDAVFLGGLKHALSQNLLAVSFSWCAEQHSWSFPYLNVIMQHRQCLTSVFWHYVWIPSYCTRITWFVPLPRVFVFVTHATRILKKSETLGMIQG